jgi:serine/threonine-protein kinase
VAPEEETAPPIAGSALAEVQAHPTLPGTPASLSAAPPLPAVIGGKYRPVRLIARGGMGAVYEVVHANTGEHLALKLMLARSLLAPELVERFRREARISSSVKSEHVVRVIDADVARDLDDVPFLVMELLEGRDLERACSERRPTVSEVLDWMRQLAPALDGAHQQGIVHRDLKPENLFLADRGASPPIIKVLDFGIAKVTSEGEGQATATGQILGTPRYMAPEQAVDAKQISAAADRFALGLIAFRLLCGRHYFTGDNWVRLLREVARGPQRRPSALGSTHGPGFDIWFARACALDARDRYPTCAEQVEALARAVDGRQATVGPWRRARPWMTAAAALAIAATAAAWATGHRRASRSDAAPRTAAVSRPAPPPAAPDTARAKPTTAALAAPAATVSRSVARKPRPHAPPAELRTRPESEPTAVVDPYADQK